MKYLTSSEIRKMYLDYFESKGHLVVPSASLIPENDPSLLWINAGVAPLKKYFDGRENPPKRRLTNSQKCIRTNDIENVGKTARHHTFFEMLGNFSIGDYFRDEALSYAYELLTSDKYFAIDKEKLYVTVYTDDKKAYDKWLSLGIKEDHIIKMDSNFWDIGPGPCGPDSEIWFDRGSKYDKDNLGLKLLKEDIENDRYIEIWNNVFSQYNHVEGLERKDFPELPHKNIDTGLGLERLVCVIQGGETNYDTDLFLPIIKEVEALSKVAYDGQMSFKVIADHVRTLTFALSDGASFSNEGRGYVLRRILRRASRFGRVLGIYEPFMYKLVPTVIKIMGDAYPNLKEEKNNVAWQIKKEEQTFLKTLASGEKRLNEMINQKKEITGEDVFKLYDTYGFPYELTEEMLLEKNIKINREEFDICMEKQRNLARSANKNSSGMNVQSDMVNLSLPSEFTGYSELETKSKVIAIYDDNGMEADIYSSGIIVLDKCPFYATSGGQSHDVGYVTGDNLKAEVTKVEKLPNKQHACYVRIIEGKINVGDVVIASVDKERRFTTAQNHSATHLLQKSLQDVLGGNVHQAGSMVDQFVLRFDFKYTGELTDEQIIKVEELVNERINRKSKAEFIITDVESAKKMGAMALFSEKYGNKVRVVKLGDSVELCGGTHVLNTGDIRRFAIKKIESKGLNVYRIEAVCDTNLENELFEEIRPYNEEMKLLLNKAKKILEKADVENIELNFIPVICHDRPTCYKEVLENRKEVQDLKKQVSELEKELQVKLTQKIVKNIDKYVNDKVDGKFGEVVIINEKDLDLNSFKPALSVIESRLNNGIVFLINKANENSVNFVCKANAALSDKFNAGLLVKDASLICDGNGGGSKSFAQGGGNNTIKIDMVLDYVKRSIIDKE